VLNQALESKYTTFNLFQTMQRFALLTPLLSDDPPSLSICSDSSLGFKSSKGSSDCLTQLHRTIAIARGQGTPVIEHATSLHRRPGATAKHLTQDVQDLVRHSVLADVFLEDGSTERRTIHPLSSERKKSDVLLVSWFFNEYCNHGRCVDYAEQLTWADCDAPAFALKAASARPHVVIGGSARAFQIKCKDSSYDRLIAQARDRFAQHGIETSTGDLFFSRNQRKDQYHLQTSPAAK
jgi:hypothetical protein